MKQAIYLHKNQTLKSNTLSFETRELLKAFQQCVNLPTMIELYIEMDSLLFNVIRFQCTGN